MISQDAHAKCKDCGDRHSPGNKHDCVECLKRQLFQMRCSRDEKIEMLKELNEGLANLKTNWDAMYLDRPRY